MNVLEAYDFIICSVCCGNSSSCFLNIFDNFVGYKTRFFSLADIINECLSMEMTNHEENPKQICCLNCKTKLVDFFIFKKRNEEVRKIYRDSQYRALILEVTGDPVKMQQDNVENDDDSADGELTDVFNNSQIYLSFNNSTFSNDSQSDIFNDDSESDTFQEQIELPHLLLIQAPIESREVAEEEEDIISAKRKFMPGENCERLRRKIAKNMGKSYVATSGKIIEEKKIKPDCGSKCRMQCNSRINFNTRVKNFKKFYELADLELQRKFILDHIQIFEPKHTKMSNSRRSIQRIFFLDGEKDGEMVQVCKLIFLNTLVISSQTLDTIQFKASNFSSMADFRGRYPRKKY